MATTTNEKINELKKIINDARDQLNDFEQARRKEHNQAFVGKFLRYRNAYNASDKWWLYAFVSHLTTDGYCVVDRFETNNDGASSIEVDQTHFHSLDDYKEITELEFTKAWKALTQKVNQLRFEKK